MEFSLAEKMWAAEKCNHQNTCTCRMRINAGFRSLRLPLSSPVYRTFLQLVVVVGNICYMTRSVMRNRPEVLPQLPALVAGSPISTQCSSGTRFQKNAVTLNVDR